MKEGATYIITLHYFDSGEDRPYTRISQEEFTGKEDELFDFIKSKIEEKKSEGIVADIISIIQDFIH